MRSTLLVLVLALGTPASALSTEIMSGETPQAVVAADLNGDGLQDLAFANAFDDTIAIHLQSLSGEFPLSATVEAGQYEGILNDFPRYLDLCDVNQDGRPDLTILCSGDFAYGYEPCIQTVVNLGDGSFAPLGPISTVSSSLLEEFPVHFCFGEFTGDQYRDVAVANLEGRSIRIMEGDGAGIYQLGQSISVDAAGDGPQDLAILDLDGNKLDDLLAVTSSALLYIGQISAGVFASPVEFGLPAAASDLRAVAVDDLNGDGAADAALADAGNRIQILYGISSSGTAAGSRVEEGTSFSGCSDIAVVYWDGDGKPDLAVTNRTGSTFSVVRSTGGVNVIPTGSSPRRLALGDLDGNGRIDVVTANEGDLSDPSNPDGSIGLNLASQASDLSLTLIEDEPLGGILASEIPHPAGLSTVAEDRTWVIECSRRSVREIDSEGRPKRRVQFGFEVGGIHFTEADKGWVLERYTPTLREFEIEDGSAVEYEKTRSFEQNPGALGFCGLARNPGTEEFFVSDPGNGRVLRLDENGETVGQFTISPPAWDMTWDRSTQRLMATNPGRSDVRVYSSTGTLDSQGSMDMGDASAVFGETGLAGVSWESDGSRIHVLTTTGLLICVSSEGSVSRSLSLSPLSGIVGVDIDGRENNLYALSKDGSVSRLDLPDLGNRELISLWPVIENDPDFVPAGIAVDEESERILIGDRHRPLVARLTLSGEFDGFEDYSAGAGLGEGPIRAIEVGPVSGAVCFRTRFTVTSTQAEASLSVPDGPCCDFGMGDLGLAIILSNPAELMLIPLSSGPQASLGTLPNAVHHGGIAFDGSGHLIQVEAGRNPTVRAFRIDQPSAVGAWSLY